MKPLVTLAALAVTLAAAHPSVQAQSRGMGRINGVVVSDAGDPIEGVTVRAPLGNGSAIESRSNDKGSFAIGGVGRGEWQIELRKPGFEPRRLKVIVEKETLNPDAITVVLKRAT